jgi:hypothetical protein
VLHAHENEPAVFVHVACAWQLSDSAVHSLMSEQLTPSPE